MAQAPRALGSTSAATAAAAESAGPRAVNLLVLDGYRWTVHAPRFLRVPGAAPGDGDREAVEVVPERLGHTPQFFLRHPLPRGVCWCQCDTL